MEPRVDALVAGVYDAVADGDRQAALLDELMCSVGASSCVRVMSVQTGPPSVLSSSSLEAANSAAYAEHYCRLDPWVARIATCREGSIVSGETFLPNAALERTEFYNDFLAPQGIFWCRSALLALEPSGPSYVTVMRPRASPDFAARDEQLLASLLPHLRTALMLQRTIGDLRLRATMLEDAVDALGVGVVLVRSDGRVAHVNRRAEELLRATPALRIAHGRLRSSDHGDDRRMRAAIAAACHASIPLVERRAAMVRMSFGTGRGGIRMLVAPFSARAGWPQGQRPEAMILLGDGHQRGVGGDEYIMRLFSLTPAELQVAMRLARGDSLDELGQHLGITRNTVRTHLKHLFGKTGTHRQGALVERLNRELSLFDMLASG